MPVDRAELVPRFLAFGGAVIEPTWKAYRAGTERSVLPETTLERIRPHTQRIGITRVADITGLDRIGLPVMAVHRPNSRSIGVAQGKGVSAVAAKASGLMEAIESHHAERIHLPLLLGSEVEMSARHPVLDVQGLPRLAVSRYHERLPLLWVAGRDFVSDRQMLVPYEVVHLDFRLPLPTGSGAFMMSSNGLASGNHLSEATSHAICELVERDANTLFQCAPEPVRAALRVDLGTIDDPQCMEVLQRITHAELELVLWETTSDIGLASFLCAVYDADAHNVWPMAPIAGSGCHPRRHIALLRALTEAAQGRLTEISGARDDLSGLMRYSPGHARSASAWMRAEAQQTVARRSYLDAPDRDFESFEEDLQWELECLRRAGIDSIVVVNLTKPEFEIPVVRVVIPYLEGMSEVEGYVPGSRAQRMSEHHMALQGATS